MHNFYTTSITQTEGVLPEAESKHAIRVLRLRENDPLHLVDGKGVFYSGVITVADARACQFRVIEHKAQNRPNYRVQLAVAPPKSSDRLEWILEKATEIGVDEIILLRCDHSERSKVNRDRLERVCIAAMKQSQRAWLPILQEPVSFDQFIETQQGEATRFIAHCYSDELPHLASAPFSHGEGNICVAIGPEGDFSQREVELARSANFREISLGKARLRTETAAIVAITLVNARYA